MNDKPQADELDILHPERTIMCAGDSVTVREIGFADSLRLDRAMAPMIRAFIDLRDDPEPHDLAALFGTHPDAWLDFMAAACGKPRAWIEGLGDEDGRNLSMAVWTVNSGFFLRRVISGVIARNRPVATSGSENSTQH
jgi:hypothetical protein